MHLKKINVFLGTGKEKSPQPKNAKTQPQNGYSGGKHRLVPDVTTASLAVPCFIL
jgi:hypothetical protein